MSSPWVPGDQEQHHSWCRFLTAQLAQAARCIMPASNGSWVREFEFRWTCSAQFCVALVIVFFDRPRILQAGRSKTMSALSRKCMMHM